MASVGHEEATSKSSAASAPLGPMVPVDYSVNNYTRFITAFEAAEFTNWIDESLSWKTGCYIGDWSQLLKLRVRGPQAQKFLEFLSTNAWPEFRTHQCKHAIMCQDNGCIVGDGLIMKLDDEDYLFTSGPGVPWAMFQFHAGKRSFDATVEIVTDDWYLFQVQGPESVELMNELTGDSTRDLKFMNAKWMSIDTCKFLCLRQGVSGELGFELWGAATDAHKVWNMIADLGSKKYKLRRLGCRAKPVNHTEAAFPTPTLDHLPAMHDDGEEISRFREFLINKGLGFVLSGFMRTGGSYDNNPVTHQRTPFDLGWGWLVKFDHEFIGRKALEKIADNPPNKYVTLVWNSEDVTDVYASLFTDSPYEFMEMPRAPGGKVEGVASISVIR